MNELIESLFSTYIESSLLDNILEGIAVLFGIISVILASKNNIWLYPIGIISTGIYVYITFFASLYGDMIIQLYYTLMSFYGLLKWRGFQKKENMSSYKISFSNRRDYFYTLLIFITSIGVSLLIYMYSDKLKVNYSWVDIFTTGIFASAMYQMAHKKMENWLFWALGNFISIPLYFYKGLILTSFQFFIFTFLSIKGYISWQRKINQKKKKLTIK